jgi:hypothetical protein
MIDVLRPVTCGFPKIIGLGIVTAYGILRKGFGNVSKSERPVSFFLPAESE